MTNTESRTAKAIKAARLAASAEGVGNEHEMRAAARRVGALCWDACITLSDLDAAVPGFSKNSGTWDWDSVVDGYYDAREEAQVTEAQVAAALDVLKTPQQFATALRQEALMTVEKMWTEITRTRRA